jgi:gluconolactonase
MSNSIVFQRLILTGILTLATAAGTCQTLKAVNQGEFEKIFAADAQVALIAKDQMFTEGPVWVPRDKGYLIYSDIPQNRLMKWTVKDGLEVFRASSNNANGNSLDLQGRLASAEHGARRVSITTRNGAALTVIASYQDRKFNSPNDLVFKSDGTLWFTDPDYGLGNREKEQPGNYVYRYDPLTGELVPVVKDFDKPNGLTFSPDESMLYVADSGNPKHIRVFPVRANNTLGPGKVFAKIDKGGPDGIKCDADGRVWSSSGDGAQVFLPDGTLIARIELPQGGANLCFGDNDLKTVFVTARKSVWSVPTLVKGKR